MGKHDEDFAAGYGDLIRNYVATACRYRTAADQYGEETATLLLSLSDTLMERANALSAVAYAS